MAKNFDELLRGIHEDSTISDADTNNYTNNLIEINDKREFLPSPDFNTVIAHEGDINSQIITFKLPAWHEGHSLFKCGNKELKWKNANSRMEGTSKLNVIQDSIIEGDSFCVTWEIPYEVCTAAGAIEISISIYDIHNDYVAFAWNTFSYSGLSVASSMDGVSNTFPPKDEILIIDKETRAIIPPMGYNNSIGNYGDINIGSLYFLISRYIGKRNTFDVLGKTVEIYARISMNGRSINSKLVATPYSIDIDNGEKDGLVLLEMPIPEELTNDEENLGFGGAVKIQLEFRELDIYGQIQKRWISGAYEQLYVGNSMLQTITPEGEIITDSVIESAVEAYFDREGITSSAIIDCSALPTENINANTVYRTNNIQFVFDRQIGIEGVGVPANVIVVEDVTKLQHTDIIPYATSNPTARNWYYDLSRQRGYCYYAFEVPAEDKSNSRYDWIDPAATEGYQWFDPEWIYRDHNGYGGTVASYDEIPTTGYKSVYFISKTSLFYYDINSHQWKPLQEEFVNNTDYDVIPTIMRKSSEVSYKTYTDGAGGGTLALRTGDGMLRARSATSGPGGDWKSPLDDFTLVNKGYLRKQLENAIPTETAPELGYEIENSRVVYYSIHSDNATSFSKEQENGVTKIYYKVSDVSVGLDGLINKYISIEQHTYGNDTHTKIKRIGKAELAKAKTYSGGTYLYDIGIWLVNDYNILGTDINPGFTSNGIYFIRQEWEADVNVPNAQAYTAYTQTVEVFYANYKEIDPVYAPQHHIAPICLYANDILQLEAGHKYYIQASNNQMKIYNHENTDMGVDAFATGQIICGDEGAATSAETNCRAFVTAQFVNSITKLVTSKNLDLPSGSYLKNTSSGNCWVWNEYFG